MLKEQLNISGQKALELGAEAVEIIRAGGYEAPSGRWVDLSGKIQRAVMGTESYPPDRPARWDPAFRGGTAAGLPRVEGFRPAGGFFGEPGSPAAVENETTLSAGRRLLAEGLNPVALNFASAVEPGGGFLRGARAQEEYLARSSALYACLEGNPMYPFHREAWDPLYTDYVIYSPEVPFFRDDRGELLEAPCTLGILTSPAVNAHDLPEEREDEIEDAMRGRIRKVLAVGLKHGHDAIVLGAWGCGAFGNDARTMAGLFREQICGDFRGAYRRIVFAIADWSREERFIGPFRKVLGEG